jgi:hypothetical protein
MLQTYQYLRLKDNVKSLLNNNYSDALIMSLLWAKRGQDISIRDIQKAMTEAKNEILIAKVQQLHKLRTV